MSKKKARSAFHELGFPEAEARNLELRSELMIALKEHIRKSGMTQKQAAEALGVTQPRISNLMNGKIDRFTIDLLVSLLETAGRRVSVKVSKAA